MRRDLAEQTRELTRITAERDALLREVLALRARVVELEAAAGLTRGQVAGLERAVEVAGLAEKLAGQTKKVGELTLELERLRVSQEECLARAQTQPPAALVPWPGNGPRWNG